jgi:hypothetical protein
MPHDNTLTPWGRSIIPLLPHHVLDRQLAVPAAGVVPHAPPVSQARCYTTHGTRLLSADARKEALRSSGRSLRELQAQPDPLPPETPLLAPYELLAAAPVMPATEMPRESSLRTRPLAVFSVCT